MMKNYIMTMYRTSTCNILNNNSSFGEIFSKLPNHQRKNQEIIQVAHFRSHKDNQKNSQ